MFLCVSHCSSLVNSREGRRFQERYNLKRQPLDLERFTLSAKVCEPYLV